MMTFYAAAGSYQIRNEDGKDMPYIMRLGKLQPVSIPEFSIWSMLLWDVLTHDELRKKYFEKMEEVKLDPSGFEKALEMLVKRKLIIKGVGYTGADALHFLGAQKEFARAHVTAADFSVGDDCPANFQIAAEGRAASVFRDVEQVSVLYHSFHLSFSFLRKPVLRKAGKPFIAFTWRSKRAS